jgi:spore maturation protein A
MLNYIWVALICLGILCAVGNDIADQVENRYRNGIPFEVSIEIQESPADSSSRSGEIVIPRMRFSEFYHISPESIASDTIRQKCVLTRNDRVIHISIGPSSPSLWQTMASTLGSKERLNGKMEVVSRGGEDKHSRGLQATIMFEPVTLVRLRAVTQSMFDYAGTAVTIAFGLIGIMALWLGMMKVAEAAGIMKAVIRLLSPVMRRLFPEIPPDHPAMGAMVMNIAANMLGLSNAATPFGIKAMEELQTLNPKKETATNPMVTFLAINTGGLTLIPATALAVRAGLGSANPAVIIGTTIVGATCATVVGILASKLLQRLPVFNREKKGGADGIL